MRWDVPVGDPNFGRAFMCECLSKDVAVRNLAGLRLRSNLDALQHLTFETFDATIPGVADALAAAREFITDTRGWLVLYGGFGVGKTHLAAAIAHALVERGTPILFQVVPVLLTEMRAAFNPATDVALRDLVNSVMRVQVLILDDFGEEYDTPWVREQLFLLLNHRYNHRLPTVITTNRPLEAIDQRICSRMMDRSLSRTVAVGAADYRQRPLSARRPTRGRSPR